MEGKISDRTPVDRAREKLEAELKERRDVLAKHQDIVDKVSAYAATTESALRSLDTVHSIVAEMTTAQRKVARLLLDLYSEEG